MTLQERARVAIVISACIAASCSSGPSPSASATATPAPFTTISPEVSAAAPSSRPTLTPIPDSLLHVWLGPPRTVAGLGGPQEMSIIRFQDVRFDFITGQFGAEALNSLVSAEGPDIVRIVSNGASGGCQSNDAGTYRWTTSTDGELLTMTVRDEACLARAEALAGDWVLAACKDFGCLGPISAGEHRSAFLEPLGQPAGSTGWRMQYGALSYTVPSGWANANDATGLYNLVLQTDYVKDVTDESAYPGIYVLVDPGVATPAEACSHDVAPGADLSAAQILAALGAIPGADIGKPVSLTVAGRAATARDVTMKADLVDRCSAEGGIPVLTDRRLRPGEHWRLIVLDLTAGHTLAIVIDDAAEPGRFGDLVAQAMPIVESFAIHPPAP